MYNSSIRISVESNIMNLNLVLDRRITIIRGDSGTGKTTLIELLQEGSPDIKVSSTFPIRIVDDTTWDAVMNGSTDSILFFDDLNCVNSVKFAHRYSQNAVKNNLYFVIIARESLLELKDSAEPAQIDLNIDMAKGISYSVNSIFSLEHEGTNYWLEPYYKLPVELSSFDTVLIEDSTLGFEFFTKLFSETNIKVIHATNGKSSFCSDASKLSGRALLLFDSAAFGCHIEQLYNEVLEKGNSFVLNGYECFEEFLLQTSFFNCDAALQNIFSDLPAHANQFISWEKFFETLINVVSKKVFYRYTHSGRLKKCYIENCKDCCNPYIFEKCNYRYKDFDKKEFILENSKYQYLSEYL